VNADGTAVVELLNTSQAPVSLSVAVARKSHPLTLPPQSFATLLVPPA
jgi:O-glycosyl hydrolase